jgi:2-phosphoglycerate kinase
MIYMIGGAPRAGKSILSQQVAAQLGVGWIATDLLFEILRLKGEPGIKSGWDAAPENIAANAEWFFPYLDRFVWGVSSLTEGYLIEGVDFLPAQVARLSGQYAIQSVFLGRSMLTLAEFDKFPGRSQGYANLPEEVRRQIVQDVPRWSEFVKEEAERFGIPYVDMSDDFPARLREAENILTVDVKSNDGKLKTE